MSFEQDDEEVRCVIRPRDSGAEETVAANYLVAADGAHSVVRERLGTGMTGRGLLDDRAGRHAGPAGRPGHERAALCRPGPHRARRARPAGGFGGNTGVADAHNLAWKLAMVLDGSAGPGLLDSYEAERAPIGALTVEQAYTRHVQRVDPSLASDDLEAQLDDPLIELGAVYGSAAELEDPGAPTGRVGTRTPHLMVELAGTPSVHSGPRGSRPHPARRAGGRGVVPGSECGRRRARSSSDRTVCSPGVATNRPRSHETNCTPC